MGRARQQLRVCERKLVFDTWDRAARQAEFDTEYYGNKHFLYRCSLCDRWHMTTQPDGADVIDVLPYSNAVERSFGRAWSGRLRLLLQPDERRVSERLTYAFPTWQIYVLLWFHETMAGLGVPSHDRMAAHQRAMLEARGIRWRPIAREGVDADP